MAEKNENNKDNKTEQVTPKKKKKKKIKTFFLKEISFIGLIFFVPLFYRIIWSESWKFLERKRKTRKKQNYDISSLLLIAFTATNHFSLLFSTFADADSHWNIEIRQPSPYLCSFFKQRCIFKTQMNVVFC